MSNGEIMSIITGVRCTFPKAFYQCDNFPSGNFPKVSLGSLMRSWLQWEPSAAARTLCRPSASAWIDLGSCRLGT